MTASASQTEEAPEAAPQLTQVKVWDLPLRLFHWLLVLAVALAFLSSEEDGPLNEWHILAGWVAGILIVFRVVWGFVGGEHSRFTDFIRPSRIGDHVANVFRRRAEPSLGHNPLGGISVVILLALVATTVWTGAFGGEGVEDVHELIAWTLLAFVGLHVAAVVIMSLLQRENLVAAMITGKKPAAHYPDAINPRRPTTVGIIFAALVLAGTVYAVLQYDPHAFTLRPAKTLERSDAATSPAAKAAERENE